MAFWNWSRTASSNGNSDPGVNFLEGQTPGSLNDSNRAAMAVLRQWGDDISGAIVSGGTSTAFTVTSYSGYDSLPHLSGQLIAFSPHTTNGATVTLNVDGLGAKPLRSAPSTELLAGTIVQGTPYLALYNNSDGAFYLHGFYPAATTYNVPLGAGMDFWGTTVPNSSFAFPIGQQISQTTYATLYTLFGPNRYGADAGGNFFLPDKTGRVSAMKEASGTRLTAAGSGVDGGTMGASGGTQSKTLLTANLPPYTPAGSVATTITGLYPQSGAGGGNLPTTGASDGFTNPAAASTFTGTAQGGTSTPFATVPPTIICEYILRIL